MEVKAVLFDTRSIQKYIFSGNKLKTNIGASYLVDKVFDDALIGDKKRQGILIDVFGDDIDIKTFFNEGLNPNDWDNMPVKCRIGYIGGGNALVLFRNDVSDAMIQGIVERFSKYLLTDYPGLRTGAAIGEIKLDSEGNFLDDSGKKITKDSTRDQKLQNGLTKLVHKLKKYQNTVFPQVDIPYTGLTLQCDISGNTATAYTKDRFYSFDVLRKIEVSTSDGDDDDYKAEAEVALAKKLQAV